MKSQPEVVHRMTRIKKRGPAEGVVLQAYSLEATLWRRNPDKTKKLTEKVIILPSKRTESWLFRSPVIVRIHDFESI